MESSASKRLAEYLDRNTLLRLAGSRSYERGECYHADRRVRSLDEDDSDTITAVVRGTRDYAVELGIDEEGDFTFSCDCPVGEDGAFCKHCVAVGLELLANGGSTKRAAAKTSTRDVRDWLARQDKELLIEMLMGQAAKSQALRTRLLMNAAKDNPKGVDFGAFRRTIDDAVFVRDFVGYRDVYDYARGIERVVSSIEDLLGSGHAGEVIELAEYALSRVENALGEVDDSDGEVGGLLETIQDLHLRACETAKPNPEELARRLFDWETRSEWDVFSEAATTYAGVLGKKGLATYRRLAEDEWAKVEPLGPGQDSLDKYGKRFRITEIMQSFARRTGDVERLVEVMSHDLSSAYDYLKIAIAYKEAGKSDKALDWAEKGMAAFPDRTDGRLREFAADQYQSRGRWEDMMACAWAEYSESPRLEAYKRLRDRAERCGSWPKWREKALATLRQQIAAGASTRRRWLAQTDNTTLVEIYLWEKDVESAWKEAQAGGCRHDLWMTLAAARKNDRPEDALGIYQAAVEPAIQQKNNDGYERAVELLLKVNDLMIRLDRRDQFLRYIDSLRASHKPKRNFIKLLNSARWK